MSAEDITSDGTARLYFNIKAVSWWNAGTNGDGNFGYFFNNSTGKNAWSAHSVKHDGDTYYVVIPEGTWKGVILTRNNTSTAPSWNNKWNQTGDITLSPNSNYISKFSEGSTSVTWGTAVKPTSTVSVTATPAEAFVGEEVSLSSALTSNTSINTYNSATYSANGGTVTGNKFTASEAGTYTITTTVTYYPNCYSNITSTATATTTVTVTIPTHTVTFGVHSSGNGTLTAKAGSTSISSDASIDEGTKVVFTATPSTGYQIEGWYSNSACTTPINNGTNNTYTVTITGGTNVYVKFEAIPANSHNITYTEQGTGWTYGAKPTSAEEGAQVTFVVTPTAGYRVSVTSTDVTLNTNGNNYTFTMPNKDVVITVDAKPEQYTVTLDNQGATTAGTTSITATYNTAMPSITIPTKTGYTFGGYYTATNGGGTQYYKADGTSATAWTETSVEKLYAKWTANTYEITYKDQGDVAFSGTHASGYPTTHTYGTATTLKSPTKNNYTFDGWFTTSTCTGTKVTSLGATTYTSDITLYAKWTEIPPTTVYLQPNDNWKKDNARFAIYCWNNEGNIWYDMTKMDCDGGNYYMVEIPVAYKDFKFVRLNPATTENNWDSGNKWNETGNLNVPTDSKVLFTVTDWGSGSWGTYSAPQYAITITNGTGGTVTVKQGANTITSGNKVNLNAVITATLAANDGYSKGTAKIKIGDNAEADLVEGQEYTICGPTTITAEFESNIRTVSFDANGHGTEPEEQTINRGEKATEPAPLTEEGYTFGGWYTEKECTTQFDFNTVITENITLYAKWNEVLSTITITTNPAEGGRIEVDGEDFVSGNTVQVGVATTKQVTAVPNEGYGVASWGVSNKEIVNASGGATVTLKSDGSGSTGTLTANFIGLEYTITFDKQKGTNGTDKATVRYMGNEYSVSTVVAPTRTGFTFGGYYSKEKGAGEQVVSAEGAWLSNANGYTDANGNWLVKGNTTLYAHWIGAPYTVELNQEGAATSGTEKVTAYYEGDMPTADVTMPTAQNGYAFMGYWDKKDGQGTQYYNADGTSAHTWDKTENATLYAYFKMAEITTITLNKNTFEPVDANGIGFVTATPSIEPKPTGTTRICWRLLYNNGTPVEGHNASTEGCEQNQVKFSIAGLSSGNYKIEAVLRTGNNCGSGTELSTKTVNFTIASTYTITVKYTCDGKEIMAASKLYASISSPTKTKAPTIPGYTFSKWVAGDGVTITGAQNGEKTEEEIEFTAIYDGYLTAQYTTRPMVYFKNTLDWKKVYVYTFTDNAWWNDGTGVHPGANKREQAEMTRIGDTDIYYYELQSPSDNYTQDNNANKNYIAFSNVDMHSYNEFYGNEAIYRGDFKNNLTLFIPQVGQTPETHNETKYYSKGIWMKYNSTESGYQLATDNQHPGLGTDDNKGWSTYGNKFTAQQPGGYTFSITKDLDANKTYEFKIKNYVYVTDWEGNAKNQWFATASQINTDACTSLPLDYEESTATRYDNIKIKTTAAGEYKFTIDLSTGRVILSVEYPVAVGDYRVVYTDNAKWSDPRNAHNNTNYNWNHPSRVIKKNTTAKEKLDTISFFISREQGITYSMKFQQCTNIANNGTITWADGANIPALKDKGESGVYNFVVTQTANGESISMGETVEPYSGNYYIRCEAMGGKWSNYKTNSDNRMTYSAFSESDANSFGEKYSHYATKYCTNGTDIKFTIANDYSPCISDTLITDIKVSGQTVHLNPFGNTDNGVLNSGDDYNANIRFMWNRKTNKISRAYIGAASENNFLVLKGNEPLDDKDVNKISSKFTDTQNWIYELNIKVKPKTLVKLYACYPKTKAEKDAQYFRGTYNNNQFVEDVSAVQILGGDDSNFYDMRVLYDFKTNRLMAAWMPSGNIEGEVSIDADVMILREHQKDAACITLTNDDSKLKDVKTVYGVMRFNRWVLNNRDATKSGIEYCTEKINNQDTYSANVTNEHHPILSPQDQKTIYERALYFISFPFDVHLSDVFGFGTYGTHWVISTYNGQRRAQNGYFVDNCINEDCTNWDYIWDPSNFVLKANTGYLLSLDLDLMKHDNMNFWLHNIENVELYFPSQSTISTIERTHYTMPALTEDYECTINFNKVGPEDPTYNPVNDHRVRDSYWRCIGVPSFANYDGSLYKTAQDADNEEEPIIWNTNYEWKANNAAFPFLYEWNVQDNSLQVQSTNKYNFRSTFAYLVQNGNPIYWSAVNTKPSNIVARNQAASEINNYEWKLTLSRNSEVEDQAFVRLSDDEQVTTEFDFNQDLSKEFNYGRSDIYTLIGYEKAAANSLPFSEQTTLIPLGLSIEYNGDYTIAMPDGTANIGVTLIDTESNTRTNLSAGMEYTLTLNKGDYNNRFFIEISPIQQTPTDIEYVTGDSNSQNSVRKVLIDNILYIVRDGQMFDARGARVK